MATPRTSIIVFVATWLAAVSAHAQNGTGIDAQENLFGATNIDAVLGHGRLTAGVSAEGDITVLSWPGPSLSDQLGYISSNAIDARDKPRFGAPEGAGITLGLACDDGDGESVTWLRDSSVWRVRQGYGLLPDGLATDGPHPVTRYASDELGLEVAVTDVIAPETDTLLRAVSVTREPESTVTSCALLTYANLSPTPPTSRIPELPIADWALDGRNDFAAIWDRANDTAIHFHPSDRRIYQTVGSILNLPPVDYGPIGEALLDPTIDPATIDTLVDTLADDYADGAWLTLTTVPAPAEHQVGFDSTDFCGHLDGMLENIEALPDRFEGFTLPLDPRAIALLRCTGDSGADVIEDEGWMYAAADPWTDAQDGSLDGADLAAGETATALRTPLTFEVDGPNATAEAVVVLGAGSNLSEARDALVAGTTDPAAIAEASGSAVEEWLTDLYIPVEDTGRAYHVAKRSLINLRVGTDVESGAIVASIARQPPYYLDWPRDGAFFNVMLDVSGQSTLVGERNRRYGEWQRTTQVSPTPILDPPPPDDPDGNTGYPAYAWEMNYYSDGTPGGTFRFEIDTTAFAVWTMVAHVGWVDDPTSYLTEHWEAIRTGADLLARWKDEETGLHAPAQEDDQANYSQTLHGAITTFGALDIAARAARLLGEESDAQRWESRARELRIAIEENFYDFEERTFFMQESGRLPLLASGQTAVGPTAWLVWPMTLYPWDTPVIRRQLRRDLELIRPILNLETPGGLYFMKNTISIALAFGSEGAFIDDFPETLAEHATSNSMHFGEVMVVDDQGRANQRVATPHLWEGALFYLTLVATEDPDRMLRYEEVLPDSRVRPGDGPAPLDPGPGMEPLDFIDGGMATPDQGSDMGPPMIGEVRGARCNCRTVPSPRTPLFAWVGLTLLGLVARRQKRK